MISSRFQFHFEHHVGPNQTLLRTDDDLRRAVCGLCHRLARCTGRGQIRRRLGLAVGMDLGPRQRSEGLSGVGRGSLGLPSSRRRWDGTPSSATGPDVHLRPKPGLSDAPSLQVLEHLQPPGRLFRGLPRACVVAAVPTVVPTGPVAG